MINPVPSPEGFEQAPIPPVEGNTLADDSQVELEIDEASRRLTSLNGFYDRAMAQNPQNPEPRAFFELLKWVGSVGEPELDEESVDILRHHRVLPLEDASSPGFGALRALYGLAVTVNPDNHRELLFTNPLVEQTE